MTREIELLLVESYEYPLIGVDVQLASVLHPDEPKSQWDLMAHYHILSIGTLVHDVNLSNDSNGTNSLRVNLPSHLQSITGSHVCVGWDYTKYDGSGVCYISMAHALSNLLDVLGLVGPSQGDSGDARQIDHGQVRASVGVNYESDWIIDNSFLGTSHFVSKSVNALPHFLKVRKLLSLYFAKLSPSLGTRFALMHQSQLKRPSCAHPRPPWQEIYANNGFQDRGFS